MGPSLLAGGLFTIVLVSGCLTAELCGQPPVPSNAVVKVPAYKAGTILVCECEKGFRRVSKYPYTTCNGNASHAAWDRKCQCVRTSPRLTGQVTRAPEKQEERSTAGQGPTQPPDLPGHCRAPPSWEHERSQRTYHFVVGQELYYECAQGFRASQREPARSVCEVSSGKTNWTQTQLTCTSEGELSPIPGVEESPPLTTRTTAGMAETTEAPLSTEEFVSTEGPFPTEYLIAGTCLALLLAGVLLLSGLTWQHRWKKMRRSI